MPWPATILGCSRALEELCPPGAAPARSTALQAAVEAALRALHAALIAEGLSSPVQAAVLLHQNAHVLALVRARAAGMGAASSNAEDCTRLALACTAVLARAPAAAAALSPAAMHTTLYDAAAPPALPAASSDALSLSVCTLISESLEEAEATTCGGAARLDALSAAAALVRLLSGARPAACAFALPGVSSSVARLLSGQSGGASVNSSALAAALDLWGGALEGALRPPTTTSGGAGASGASSAAAPPDARSASAAAIDALRARAAGARVPPPPPSAAAASAAADGASSRGACAVARDGAWAAQVGDRLAPLLAQALPCALQRGARAREAVALLGARLLALALRAPAAADAAAEAWAAAALGPSVGCLLDVLAISAADASSARARATARAALAAAATAGSRGGGARAAALLEARLMASVERLAELPLEIDEAAKWRLATTVGTLVVALGGGSCEALRLGGVRRVARALGAALEPARGGAGGGSGGGAYGSRLPHTRAQLDAAAAAAATAAPPLLAHARSSECVRALCALPSLVGAAVGGAALADALLADALDVAGPPARRLGALVALAQLVAGGAAARRALRGGARWGAEAAGRAAAAAAERAAERSPLSQPEGALADLDESGTDGIGSLEAMRLHDRAGTRAHAHADAETQVCAHAHAYAAADADADSDGSEDATSAECERVCAERVAMYERIALELCQPAFWQTNDDSDDDDDDDDGGGRAAQQHAQHMALLLSSTTGGLGLATATPGASAAPRLRARALDARESIQLHALALAAIAACARASGGALRAQLQIGAMPCLLECLGDERTAVAHAAYAALATLARAAGDAKTERRARRTADGFTAAAEDAPDGRADATAATAPSTAPPSTAVSALVVANLDALVDAAARQLRRARAHPRAAQLVVALLRCAPADALPVVFGVLGGVLDALDDAADDAEHEGSDDDGLRAAPRLLGGGGAAPRAPRVGAPLAQRAPTRALCYLRVLKAAAAALDNGDGPRAPSEAQPPSAEPPTTLCREVRAAVAEAASSWAATALRDDGSHSDEGDEGEDDDAGDTADGVGPSHAADAAADDADAHSESDGEPDGESEPSAREALLLEILQRTAQWLAGGRLAESLAAMGAAQHATAALGAKSRVLLPAVHQQWMPLREQLTPHAQPRARAAALRLAAAWLRSPARAYLRGRAPRELVPAVLAALAVRGDGDFDVDDNGGGDRWRDARGPARAHASAIRCAALDVVVALEQLDRGATLAQHAHALAAACALRLARSASDGAEGAAATAALCAIGRADADAVHASLAHAGGGSSSATRTRAAQALGVAARSVLRELARARRADVSAILAAADTGGAWAASAERESPTWARGSTVRSVV
jgi:hypothetical protein